MPPAAKEPRLPNEKVLVKGLNLDAVAAMRKSLQGLNQVPGFGSFNSGVVPLVPASSQTLSQVRAPQSSSPATSAALCQWLQTQLALQAGTQLPLHPFSPAAFANGGSSSTWQPVANPLSQRTEVDKLFTHCKARPEFDAAEEPCTQLNSLRKAVRKSLKLTSSTKGSLSCIWKPACSSQRLR